MQTRCPECHTVFVVTSEQLRAKAGKVRCGRCQAVFNAFDQLVVETLPQGAAAQPTPVPRPVPVVAPAEVSPSMPVSAAATVSPQRHSEAEPAAGVEPGGEPLVDAAGLPKPLPPGAPTPPATTVEIAPGETGDQAERHAESPAVAGTLPETTEASVGAVRAAGLAAARELSEAPGYNRWAAGMLAGDGSGGFAGAAERPLRWPYALAALLLAVALSAQLLYHYRVAIGARAPQVRALLEAAGIEVALPRESELVSIESSDLQSDNARGLLLLQAQLRNRAAFVQDWPHLELTLTDADDRPLARRVLAASDYLPPGGASAAFPPASDVPVRLWLEPQGVTAAGYRLYVFYP